MVVRWLPVSLVIGCSSSSSSPPAPPPPSPAAAAARDAAPETAEAATPPAAVPVFEQLEVFAAAYRDPGDGPPLVPYRDKAMWGAADRKGHVVVPARYDSVQPYVGGRARVERGGSCGYIDRAGVEVVPITFGHCQDFHDGIGALAISDVEWIYVDRMGRPIDHALHGRIEAAGDGLIGEATAKGIAFLDHTGKPRIRAQYPHARAPSEGLICLPEKCDGGACGPVGAIDETGKVVIPFQYATLSPFDHGLAFASKDGKSGVVDKTNHVVVPFAHENLWGDPSAELFTATDDADHGARSYVYGRDGKLVATLPLDVEESFSEGLAVFRSHDKHGLVDATGKVIVPARYDFITGLHRGRAWVTLAGRSGFIDRTGAVVVPLRYGSLYDYNQLDDDDLLVVSDGPDGPAHELTFYIDRDGHEYMSADTRAWWAKQPRTAAP